METKSEFLLGFTTIDKTGFIIICTLLLILYVIGFGLLTSIHYKVDFDEFIQDDTDYQQEKLELVPINQELMSITESYDTIQFSFQNEKNELIKLSFSYKDGHFSVDTHGVDSDTAAKEFCKYLTECSKEGESNGTR